MLFSPKEPLSIHIALLDDLLARMNSKLQIAKIQSNTAMGMS